MQDGKTILVVGGAGYIGSHATALLSDQGYSTVVFDNLVYGHAEFAQWGEFVEGEISQLQPSIGLGSRAVVAIVDLESPGNLRPMATLSGRVLIETRKNAVMVPTISIVRRPAGELVYIIKDGKAEARQITTGQHLDGLVEALSGLSGGEIVATDGAAFLTDGVNVRDTGSSN